MRLTNEKKITHKKYNKKNIFINFIDSFYVTNIFLNDNFLTKLKGKLELNKFKTKRLN